MTLPTGDLGRSLGHVVEGAMGEPVTIASLVRLKGGYSREMWSFDARTPTRVRPLVLCADLETGVVEDEDSLGREAEARLLVTLHAAGLPVPGVLCADGAAGPLGRPFLVMERIAGTAAVGPLLRDPAYVARREDFGRQQAEILAAVHSVAVPFDVVGPPPEPQTIAAGEVARWARVLAGAPGARTTVLRAAERWLEQHPPPPPARVVLVHGDYRTGNLMHGPEGFRSVLDWEMAHPGDPLEDLAFASLVCWRMGTPLVGGLVSPDRWVELYEQASECSVDRDALRFWEVLGAVKMAALTRRVGDLLPTGRERDLLRALSAQLEADLGTRLLRQATTPSDLGLSTVGHGPGAVRRRSDTN